EVCRSSRPHVPRARRVAVPAARPVGGWRSCGGGDLAWRPARDADRRDVAQVMARCSAALPPDLPPGAYQTPSMCCATSTRPVGLVSGSCPSARSFLLALRAGATEPFGAPSRCARLLSRIGHPFRVGFRWWFRFISGIPTGDLNPVYNVPMLGTHKTLVATGDNVSS